MTTEVLGTNFDGSPDPSRPWVVTSQQFGSRLALVRWRMGWNQKEAARACGLSAASWRSWELDGVLPRHYIAVCTLIAARTGADKDWLIDGRLDEERVTRCYVPEHAQCTPIPLQKPRQRDRRPVSYPATPTPPSGPRRARRIKSPTA